MKSRQVTISWCQTVGIPEHVSPNQCIFFPVRVNSANASVLRKTLKAALEGT